MDAAAERKHYRYFSFVMAAFITVMLSSNLIGPAKICVVFGLAFGAGNIFFPISYIFGDVITEVYGYAMNRKVIWAGFAALVFAAIVSKVILELPPDPGEPFNEQLQPALQTVFGTTWRVIAASMLAFWAGDFANAYVMARMKVATSGRWLWTRTIGSTIVGQGVDSLLFYPLAFFGIWSTDQLVQVVAFNFCFKVGIEVVGTPVTYAVVRFLKQKEGEDWYDKDTDFTPFSLEE